jgi:nitroreductase
MIRDLVLQNRSYRRFHQDVAVDRNTLLELVDLARLSASSANRQPLKYLLSFDSARNALIFPTLSWAAYLKDWNGPAEGERPSAYIIILGDTSITSSFSCDHGIAAQSIMLGATERGLGGCMITSIQRERLRPALRIPEHLEILLAIALGTPAETVLLEPMGSDGDFKYWRDAEGRHHVPKRPLEELVVE